MNASRETPGAKIDLMMVIWDCQTLVKRFGFFLKKGHKKNFRNRKVAHIFATDWFRENGLSPAGSITWQN